MSYWDRYIFTMEYWKIKKRTQLISVPFMWVTTCRPKDCLFHKVHINQSITVPHPKCMGPPTPSQRVCPPRNQCGTHLPPGEGGGSQFQRLEKKPSTVSTLWSIFVTELSITRTVKLHAKLIKIIDISERISSTCRFVQSILYICFHLIVLMLIVLMKRRKYI
jgi:hypothetical protein